MSPDFLIETKFFSLIKAMIFL